MDQDSSGPQKFQAQPGPRIGGMVIFVGLIGATLSMAMLGLSAQLAALPAGAALLTVFAVAGIATWVKIIDGFIGLASTCVVIMLGALANVACQVDDPLIGQMALAGIGAVLGFVLWSLPVGFIFLGDGGAYSPGFFVAESPILLLYRNPGEVSPTLPLLALVLTLFGLGYVVLYWSIVRFKSPRWMRTLGTRPADLREGDNRRT